MKVLKLEREEREILGKKFLKRNFLSEGFKVREREIFGKKVLKRKREKF